MPTLFISYLIVDAFFFAEKMRAAKYVTMIDPFSTKYGARMGGIISTTAIMGNVLYCASILTALGSLSLFNTYDCFCKDDNKSAAQRLAVQRWSPHPIPDAVSLNANRGIQRASEHGLGSIPNFELCACPLIPFRRLAKQRMAGVGVT